MANVKDVDANELIKIAAAKLKELNIEKPNYIGYVKTSAGKERMPADEDFWYVRCASVLRQVYLKGPIGVSRLRTKYGTRKRHAVRRHHYYRGSGSIIRDSLITLEKIGYVQKAKKGRIITAKGKSFLDKISNEIIKTGA
ncbi:MAG: 30S ribosomal protein S19e [Candidatus Micrarchaeia archaeon]